VPLSLFYGDVLRENFFRYRRHFVSLREPYTCAFRYIGPRHGGNDIMRKGVIWLVVVLAVAAVPLLAQSHGSDTLAALLTEVRLLRLAMERSATIPQIQLLGTRLTVQNDRLQRAISSHETAQTVLQQLLNAIGENRIQLQNADEEARSIVGPTGGERSGREREIVARQSALKEQLAILTAQEPQLRGRESELAAAVAAEQNQWLRLNRRLDEVEQSLGKR